MKAHVLVAVTIASEHEVKDDIRGLAEKHGVELEQIDVIFGDLDIFFTVRTPDDRTMSSFTNAVKRLPAVTRTVVYIVAAGVLESEIFGGVRNNN